MRRIALVNQKGGVGKTTTAVNLGAALALAGKRVLLVDLDPQANLSLHLGLEIGSGEPSSYTVLTGATPLGDAIRPTGTPRLSMVASNIDLSGAELELSNALGRELLLRDAVLEWVAAGVALDGVEPVDYLLIDCPPSLGLLSVNGLAAAGEVFVAVQTEFFALQGMSKLVEIVRLLRRRIHPGLELTGIVPCLYDSRLRLAREVLGEIRKFFPGQVFQHAVHTCVKLAEAPSYGKTIFDYAPESRGGQDYRELALEVIAQEPRPPAALAALKEVELQPAPPPAVDPAASARDGGYGASDDTNDGPADGTSAASNPAHSAAGGLAREPGSGDPVLAEPSSAASEPRGPERAAAAPSPVGPLRGQSGSPA